MAKYEWSEVFMSIEGEARWAGHPTVYIRFARCNFQCRGFNNQTSKCPTCNGHRYINFSVANNYMGEMCTECKGLGTVDKAAIEKDGYASLGWKPEDYKSLNEIPLITRGCDSQYAVNPRFAHMWGQGDEKALAAEVLKVLPHNTFQNPETGKRVILSLTGGEPTIRLKFWIPILEELYQHGMRQVLVETNCAAPMRDKDLSALYEWVDNKNMTQFGDNEVRIIWSNSPKIRMSGEIWEDAIRPEIAIKQVFRTDVEGKFKHQCRNLEQYFKFVCGPTDEDFNEVAQAMKAYHEAGIPKNADVYIMPVACTEEQQQQISSQVAQMCMDKGYIYCHRIQNSVFGNGVGT